MQISSTDVYGAVNVCVSLNGSYVLHAFYGMTLSSGEEKNTYIEE